jgi:23S rRNA (cytosine1962-C5)-methyltransferase
VFIARGLSGYKILDTGDGRKLERWGAYTLSRPDPQVIWKKSNEKLWEQADAIYNRGDGGGSWTYMKKLPDRWVFEWEGLRFFVRPTGFKHTGIFPEQSQNWRFIMDRLGDREGMRMLNLFAYTGGASLAAAAAGAEVTHVDAAKSIVEWAKENAALSGLSDKPIRYIVDDCMKFVRRERRRERKYDAIVMDPPSYGRGAGGKTWKLEDDMYGLIAEAAALLSDAPAFFIVNSYTTGLSHVVAANMLELLLKSRRGGRVSAGVTGIAQENACVVLPCGNTARWTP